MDGGGDKAKRKSDKKKRAHESVVADEAEDRAKVSVRSSATKLVVDIYTCDAEGA